MDADRFDDVTRALARGATRRALLRGLAGSLTAGLIGLRASGAEAQTRQPNGTPCSRATQCASFKCVDGVCCNANCTGQCESCASGACLPVVGAPVGNRPACAGTGVCRGVCNGVQRTSCAVYPGLDVVCADPVCEDGWQTTYGCGGDGTCHPTTTSCGLFVCNAEGTACVTRCASNDDCLGAAHCAGGICQGDKGLGEPCTTADDCLLGFCTDGVCCAEACAGACETCGADGFCRDRDCSVLDNGCLVGICNPATGVCETAPADDGASCDGGRCCGGSCVDIDTDLAHCGRCNNPCPEPENNPCQVAACLNGTCDLAPGIGGTVCLAPQCGADGRVVLSGVCHEVRGLCERITDDCTPFAVTMQPRPV